MQRRRKIDTETPIEELPKLDTLCAACWEQGLREIQRQSPGGATCKYGHGGADGLDPVTQAKALGYEGPPREAYREPSTSFEVRDGDTLTIKFDGANLQIAPYTSVMIDSAIYSRKLLPGDDPDQEFDRIYTFLRRQVLDRAKAKLADFAAEVRAAKERAAK